jgi:hypothetical protein
MLEPRLGRANSPRDVLMCLDIFVRWQDIHARAQVRRSYCTPGQTKRWEMSFAVAVVPRWPRLCTVLNTCHRRVAVTYGRVLVAEVSQCTATSEAGTRIFPNRRAVVPCKRALSFASFACSSSKASGETDTQTASTRDRALATTLSFPDICRISVVNCYIKSRLLKCCGLNLSRFWLKA